MKHLTIWLVPALLVVGCASSPKKTAVEPKPEPKPTKPPAKSFATGSGSMIRRDEKQQIQWTLNWQKAQLNTDPTSPNAARVLGLAGSIYRDNQPICDIQSKEGIADQSKNIITLDGNVKLEHLKSKGLLLANSARWLGGYEIFEARGDVRLQNNGYVVGPLPVMYATADLKLAGTPDVFKATIEKKQMQAKAKNLILPALAATAIAGHGSASMQNKVGDIIITSYSSVKRTVIDDDTIEFTVKGSPFQGNWSSKRLSVECASITGRAKRDNKGVYQTSTATMSGGLKATAVRENKSGKQTSVLTSERMVYSASGDTSGKAHFPGRVNITNNLVNGDAKTQLIKVSGASGDVLFTTASGSSESPIKHIELSGGVTANLNERTKADGKTKRLKINATGNSLDYSLDSDGGATLTLTGNVHFTGENSQLFGDSDAAIAIVKINAKGEAYDVELRGAPATSTVKEKKKDEGDDTSDGDGG